ncbi:MAG: sulfatase-like hydrolase/transferase, partial [Bacteroidales bacterium]|nr:sulfatase-like hydrolase/transferase [Bacteroidales bacterium]
HDKPFLAVVWFHTPHSPVIAGKKYLAMYPDLNQDQQHYFGTITAMDEQIGRLRHELEDLQIDRNTMIWFTSDNGPAARGGGPGDAKGGRQQGETGGFRERKGSLYEGGIRVPGILYWPEKIAKNRETNYPAVTTDYFPTIIDLLGISLDNQAMLDGVSLRDIIESDTGRIRNKPIGFQSRYKKNFMTAWSDDRYKLVSKDNRVTFELYDIVNDPYERYNIARRYPELVMQMTEELDEWMSSINEGQIQDNLYHINPAKLAALVESDKEANMIFQDIKALADAGLVVTPSPVDTIFYEGLIDADPRRVHSKECLKDAPRAENLAWTFMVTREDKYADKAREIILAWSKKHVPVGNPISEKELIPMITA